MDVGTLETLHRSLSPADYSGQGGGPSTNGKARKAVMRLAPKGKEA
jgi:hypothetical protein